MIKGLESQVSIGTGERYVSGKSDHRRGGRSGMYDIVLSVNRCGALVEELKVDRTRNMRGTT